MVRLGVVTYNDEYFLIGTQIKEEERDYNTHDRFSNLEEKLLKFGLANSDLSIRNNCHGHARRLNEPSNIERYDVIHRTVNNADARNNLERFYYDLLVGKLIIPRFLKTGPNSKTKEEYSIKNGIIVEPSLILETLKEVKEDIPDAKIFIGRTDIGGILFCNSTSDT